MEQTAIETVMAWQRASNAVDREQLLALSVEDIAIAGPRGTTYGSAELLAWLARSGVQLRTLQLFAQGRRVVVEQGGSWPDPITGLPDDEQRLATVFEVVAGRVVALTRYGDLAAALAASGLQLGDRVPLGPDRADH